jgi:hypothetical protein
MTLKQAIADAGRVTIDNTKMPGTTFPISAKRCKTGAKLVKVEGSVCSKCYALRLQAFRPSVDQGWEANYLRATTMIERNPVRWSEACAYQINRAIDKGSKPFHRWFDSGDLQSVAMLAAIVRVCELTPHVRHWLPTREAGIVRDYYKAHGYPFLPANLVVRVSSTMIGDEPRPGYTHTSTVHKHGQAYAGQECEARTRGNTCGPCRACWDATVPNVSYPLH